MSLRTWDDGKPHFKSEIEPSSVSRRKRRADEEKKLREAYADVDLRDSGYCWASGRYTSPLSIDPRAAREHHHLKGRRVKPEWKFRPERIITLAKEVHDLVTRGWIVVEGCDARKRILFHWASFVKSHPFELKPRHRQEVE